MAQTDFIALYRGQTVADARLVAVTAEPEIVARFLRELTGGVDRASRVGEKKNHSSTRPLQVVRDAEE